MVDTTTHPSFITLLKLLNLEDRKIDILSQLYTRGTSTILELSRATSIPRSTLYRIIEELRDNQLVDEVVDEYVVKWQLAPFSRIRFLIDHQKHRMQEAEELFQEIQRNPLLQSSLQQPETQIIMYRGQNGIRQMIWNVLAAEEIILGYTYRVMEPFIGEHFMHRWKEERERLKLHGRDIFSDDYVRSLKTYPQKKNDHWPQWESRYISPKKLNINHQMDIYNDVVAIYNWHEGEVFGVEIHNNKVATFQKQLFELVWQHAQLHQPKKLHTA